MVKRRTMTSATYWITGRRGHGSIAVALVALLLTPGASLAAGVEKGRWFDQMEKAVPNNFCSEQQYFRQCFEVDAKTCQNTLAKATRDCIGQLESDVPDELDGEARQQWGERVGQCAGETYEASLADKRIDSQRCNNADNWL